MKKTNNDDPTLWRDLAIWLANTIKDPETRSMAMWVAKQIKVKSAQ